MHVCVCIGVQPKMSMVSKTLKYSGYDQLHFFCLFAIIWITFCWGIRSTCIIHIDLIFVFWDLFRAKTLDLGDVSLS